MSRLCVLTVFVGLAGSSVAPDSRAAPENGDASHSIRVMTFNVRYANRRDGVNQWKSRKETFAASVRAFNPDLLGTQEVIASQFEDLCRMFPEYTAVGVARDDGDKKGEWSAIFIRAARFEPLATGNFWLSETPDVVGSKGWDAACARICTWVRLRDRQTGKAFLHANTHFDHEGSVARTESAKLLAQRLDQLGAGKAVILTGDFNCAETDEPYKLLTSEKPAGFGLRDSYREVHPERSPEEATFHAFTGRRTGSRIDWILHTAHFSTRAAEIVRTSGEPHPSDHYPVTATFTASR